MIKFLLFLSACLAFDFSDCIKNGHEDWMCNYMKQHKKNYTHKTEFLLRKTKVSQSKQAIKTLGDNYGLTSMSDKFRLQQTLALSLSHHKHINRGIHLKHVYTPPLKNLKPIDWRHYQFDSFVTPIIDQGSCGDCFAFASATVLEYWLKKATGELKPLSPQFFMDCTSGNGRPNVGCDGGLMEYVFEFGKKHPIVLQKEDRYKEIQSHCPLKMTLSHLKVSGYRVLMRSETANAEDQIESLLHKYGPVSIGIDSTSMAMSNYRHGLFKANHCGKNIDHAVAIVGYTENAWIIKNSWGLNWGRGGYLYLERGKNACGVAEYIVYITGAEPKHAYMSTSWHFDA